MKKLLGLCCILLLFFTGCGEEKEELPKEEKQYEFTDYSHRVQEPHAVRLQELEKVVIYHGNYADYYMDGGLDAESRDFYVDSSERILEIVATQIEIEEPIQIYALEDALYYNPSENQCLLGPEYAGNFLQASLLVQTVLDAPTANYGLLQTTGMWIARELEWDYSSVPAVYHANYEEIDEPKEGIRYELEEKSKIRLTEEQYYLLDFEYPCYVPDYVTEEEAQIAWQLTRDFALYLMDKGKVSETFTLLKRHSDLQAFEQGFTALRNQWLSETGTDIVLTEREYPVQYGNYGRFALMQMKSLHGNWYVHCDLRTWPQKVESYKKMFLENYGEVRELMKLIEQEMEEVKQTLADKDYVYLLPEIHFTSSQSNKPLKVSGRFDVNNGNVIYSKGMRAILHEYCHYLLLQESLQMRDGQILQQYEGQQHLLPYYYGYYSLAKTMDSDYVKQTLLERQDEEAIGELLDLLRATHGEDFFEQEDWLMKYWDAECYYFSFYQFTESSSSSLTSFSHYLVDNYGEDFLTKVATGNDKVYELVGRTWEELVEEWEAYLRSIYDVDAVS